MTPSSIGVPASLYSDSDDIEIRSVGLEVRLRSRHGLAEAEFGREGRCRQ